MVLLDSFDATAKAACRPRNAVVFLVSLPLPPGNVSTRAHPCACTIHIHAGLRWTVQTASRRKCEIPAYLAVP
jgi:hypothetical protein